MKIEITKNYKRYLTVIIIVFAVYVLFFNKSDEYRDYESVMKDKTVIIVSTMHRVGSTKIFNAIRKIHEVLGEEYYSSFIDDTTISPPYNYHNPAKVHIIKLHSPQGFRNNQVIYDVYQKRLRNFSHDNSKRIYWITAKRDLRDMVASQVRVGKHYPDFYNIDPHNIKQIFTTLRTNLEWYYAYQDLSDYEVKYEDFVDHTERVILEIARAICKKLNDKQVQEVKKYLDQLGDQASIKQLSEKERVQSILADEHHITSNKLHCGYKETLDKGVISKIEQSFHKELAMFGY
jgi:hypothetical protein